METWREISEFPGYSVSDHGRVRNEKTGRILKPFPRGYDNEYLGVDLFRYGTRFPRLVHRLVAQAFLPPAPSVWAREVNHFDLNPHNNHVSNLEWVTRSENEAHKRFMRAQEELAV